MNKVTAKVINGELIVKFDNRTIKEWSKTSTNIYTLDDMISKPFTKDIIGRLPKKVKGKSHDQLLFVYLNDQQFLTVSDDDLLKSLIKLKTERLIEEEVTRDLKKQEITVRLSSRGWGDYSALVWTGDRRKSSSEILKECRELIQNGNDVDETYQTDEEIMDKIEKVKGEELQGLKKELSSCKKMVKKLENQKLVETREEAIAQERKYNDVMNEGSEGYVPNIYSKEDLECYKKRVYAIQEAVNDYGLTPNQ